MGKPEYSGGVPYVRSKAIVKLQKELAEQKLAIKKANNKIVAGTSSKTFEHS